MNGKHPVSLMWKADLFVVEAGLLRGEASLLHPPVDETLIANGESK